MEGESLLDTLFDDESTMCVHDIDMQDVEEGELVEELSTPELGGTCNTEVSHMNQDSNKRNTSRKKKKKNKRKPGYCSDMNVTDINRFVLDVCKRLRERKSYLVYTAVGCLGVSALNDLVKEVDAIQASGGQKTADGGRFRNGGGILWNIIKVRDPNAYKEIMIKGKEFEKQFKQQHEDRNTHKQQSKASSGVKPNMSNGVDILLHEQDQPEESTVVGKRASVHDRIRIPVTYDDLVGAEGFEDA